MGGNFRWRSDQVLFELLGQFSHQGNLDIAEDQLDFFHKLVDVVGAGVKDLGGFLFLQLFQQVNALGTFLWGKILEGKVVRGHAAADQGGNHGAWAGNGPDVDAFADAFSHQVECRVGDSRGASVTDKSDVSLVLQVFHIFRGDLFLVEVVVRLHGGSDAVIVEKDAGVAGILGQDQGHFLEGADSTIGDVFHVSDRSCYNVESMHSLGLVGSGWWLVAGEGYHGIAVFYSIVFAVL